MSYVNVVDYKITALEITILLNLIEIWPVIKIYFIP